MHQVLSLSRREFLQLVRAGAVGLALPQLHPQGLTSAPPASQGRMVLSGIGLFEYPAFKAKKLHVFGRDEVVSLSGQVEGDEGNAYNHSWYEINGEGFTYSGWVQPVETSYQQPVFDLPHIPQLGEVVVPVSVTRLEPFFYARNGLRLYYGSTYWITRIVVTREEKSVWYELYDGKLNASFFAHSYEVRLVPDDELTMLSPGAPEALKYIHLDLGAQLVTAFEGDEMVLSARCSSGAKGTRTPTGEFRTYHKGASIHMSNEGDDEANVYNLPGVPWVSFFTGTGVGFHGTYWHNDYGRPRSHGCVNLPMSAAKFIFRWTRPVVPPDTPYLHLPGEGTRVEVTASGTS